ncbi:MAG: OFA family MFS transporter [Eubacteriales bacterium]
MEQKVKNRYVILAAGMLIQLCAGIIYMWSVFKNPVAAYLDWDPAKASLTSSIMLCAFVAGIVVGGRAQDKLGPKAVVLSGSILISTGMLLTSLVNSSSPTLVYLTYGVISGFGVGSLYTTTVTIVQKWFADRRGFATGMMVSAFGFSLVIFTPLAKSLLASKGVPFTFTAIGVLFLVICVLCSLLISNPPAGWVPAGFKAKAATTRRHYKTSEMLGTKQFYLIAFSMFFILSAYFIVNPMFISLGMERGLSEDFAVLGVMITGIASATGRLTFSWLSDLIGRKGAVLSVIAVTFVFALLLTFATGGLYIVCIAAIAFAFGGSAGVYPALTADNFGTKFGGLNYGCVMVGFGVSALVFPIISNNLKAADMFWMSFIVSAVACAVAAVLVLLIKKPVSE